MDSINRYTVPTLWLALKSLYISLNENVPGRIAPAQSRAFPGMRFDEAEIDTYSDRAKGNTNRMTIRHTTARREMMQIRLPLRRCSALLRPRLTASLYLACLLIAHSVAAQTPTIRLFPTEVVENVKETGRVARDMENSLQKSLGDLEQQWLLYRESKCEGAVDDPGCDQIAKQLGDTYLEMLLRMDASLPRMQALVQTTVSNLEKRLREEFGLRMSARDLQKLLADQSPNGRRSGPNSTRQPIGRLSERFRQYYQLAAQSQATTPGSMAVVAAEIYLDGKEVLELIALTQSEIARSQVMIEMRNEFGKLTPELNDVITGVKGILFGEESLSYPGALQRHPDTFPENYRSPLELDD
jgi:hypothetical protein